MSGPVTQLETCSEDDPECQAVLQGTRPVEAAFTHTDWAKSFTACRVLVMENKREMSDSETTILYFWSIVFRFIAFGWGKTIYSCNKQILKMSITNHMLYLWHIFLNVLFPYSQLKVIVAEYEGVFFLFLFNKLFFYNPVGVEAIFPEGRQGTQCRISAAIKCLVTGV